MRQVVRGCTSYPGDSEETEVLFQYLVHPFRLSIGLRVVSGGGSGIEVQELQDFMPEV